MMEVSSESFNTLIQERDELENRCDRLAGMLDNALSQHETTAANAETWQKLYNESMDQNDMMIDEHNRSIEILHEEINRLKRELEEVKAQPAVVDSISEAAVINQPALFDDPFLRDSDAATTVRANEALRSAFFLITEETYPIRVAVFGEKKAAKMAASSNADRFEQPSIDCVENLTMALDYDDHNARLRYLEELKAINEEILIAFRKAVVHSNALAMRARDSNIIVEKPAAEDFSRNAEQKRPLSSSSVNMGGVAAGSSVRRPASGSAQLVRKTED